MKTIEQIARELGDDWDTTLPEDKVFIENVAKAYLSAWLEQHSQEPVAYMASSGTCITAEDVSYTPNWTDYYTTPLVRQADAAAVIAKLTQERDEATRKYSESVGGFKRDLQEKLDQQRDKNKRLREQLAAKDAEIDLAADRLEVMEREHAEFFDRWHGERRRREKLVDDVERCYRMLLSEPNTKGALFKAENILREALADAKAATHNAKLTGSGTASAGLPGYASGGNGEQK